MSPVRKHFPFITFRFDNREKQVVLKNRHIPECKAVLFSWNFSNSWSTLVENVLQFTSIQSHESARLYSSILLVNCEDYLPLIRNAPPFPPECSVSRRQLRLNERASVSNSSSPRTRAARSCNFAMKNNEKEWEKGKNNQCPWKNDDRLPGAYAAYDNNYETLRGAKCMLDRASISELIVLSYFTSFHNSFRG